MSCCPVVSAKTAQLSEGIADNNPKCAKRAFFSPPVCLFCLAASYSAEWYCLCSVLLDLSCNLLAACNHSTGCIASNKLNNINGIALQMHSMHVSRIGKVNTHTHGVWNNFEPRLFINSCISKTFQNDSIKTSAPALLLSGWHWGASRTSQ